MAANRQFFQGGMNKKNTESHWRSTILAKEKSCFSIASLLKDTTIQLRKQNGCRTPNIRFFVGMLTGPKNLFDSDQNLPSHWNNALKCKTLSWRKRNNLCDRYVQNINNVNDKMNNSKEENTSITKLIGKLDGGTTESHGETRRQRLHLQYRSGTTHNGRRVGAHGIHIIWEMVVIPTVWLQRGTHTQCAWLKTKRDLQASLCPKTSVVIWCATGLIHGCSHAPSSMSTSSSSPANRTTQREHSAHHALLQDHQVDKLRHQESLWREDLQSGWNPCTTTPTPSNSRCSLMCSSGKSLTKTRFTSLISKCSSGGAASLVSSSLC